MNHETDTDTPLFYIYIETEIELDVNDVWPDGDAPENPTAEDVAQVMRSHGDKNTVLHDWDLLHDLDLEVSDGVSRPVNPWRPR